MIWSVDQDDTSYTALSDLYPGITAFAGGTIEAGDQCMVSPCGAPSCGLGQVCVSFLSSPSLNLNRTQCDCFSDNKSRITGRGLSF